MIVRPRPHAWQLLFVMRGSIVPKIAGKLAVVVAAAVGAVWLQARFAPLQAAHFASVPFSLLGLALSVFLGFRNNVCYDRWWEARRRWGELLTASRTLAREALAALPGPASPAVPVVRRSIGFAHALAARLRDGDAAAASSAWAADDDERAALARAVNPCNLLAARNAEALAAWRREGRLGEVTAQALLGHVAGCSAVQAACERLKHTPTPFAYALLLHRTAWLFCLLLPFGLAPSLGLLTPAVVAIVAYTFFGLDALGDELEEPFGRADNDLPLDALVRTIEIDLLEALGEPPPPPLAPQDYVLS